MVVCLTSRSCPLKYHCLKGKLERYSDAVHTVQVYDVVLDAALRAQNCGPHQLLVQGEWEWLLIQFAGRLQKHKIFLVPQL